MALEEIDNVSDSTASDGIEDKNKVSYYRALKLVSGQFGPSLGEIVVSNASNFVNNLFLARAPNPDTFPASNLISSILSFFMTVDKITISVVGPAVSQVKNDNPLKVGQVFRNGIVLSTVCMGIPTIVFTLCSGPALKGLNIDHKVADIVQSYFRGLSFGVLPSLWLATEKQLVVGRETNPNSVFLIEAINASITIAGGHLLINGDFGLPSLGAEGLGYATSLSAWLCFGGYTMYLACRQQFRPFKLFHFDLGDRDIFKDLSKNALSIGLQFSMEFGIILLVSVMIGQLGKVPLAAQQIANQYVYLILSPIMALSRSIMNCIGQAKGRNELHIIKPMSLVANGLGLGIISAGLLSCIIAADPLVNIFVDDTLPNKLEVMELAKPLVWMNVLTLLPDCMRYLNGFSLVPLNKPQIPTLAGIIGLLVCGFSLACLFDFALNWGPQGFALARGIGVSIGAAMVTRSLWPLLDDLSLAEPLLAEGEHEQLTRVGTPDTEQGLIQFRQSTARVGFFSQSSVSNRAEDRGFRSRFCCVS